MISYAGMLIRLNPGFHCFVLVEKDLRLMLNVEPMVSSCWLFSVNKILSQIYLHCIVQCPTRRENENVGISFTVSMFKSHVLTV